jgi:hypothetical protein
MNPATCRPAVAPFGSRRPEDDGSPPVLVGRSRIRVRNGLVLNRLVLNRLVSNRLGGDEDFS